MELCEITSVENTIPFEDYSRNPNQSESQPPKISPMSVVDPKATVGMDVEIGPFCVVGPDVKIGDGCVLDNNISISGHVTLGRNNRIYPGVVIGGEPQDVSYSGTPTEVIIGDDNVFRECVTINRASEKEDGYTKIGNNCYLMGCVHVAHDCILGDNIVIANGTVMGGHVRIDNNATISGNVGITHYSSIGAYSFVGATSRILQDIPPYMLADGNPARPRCVNIVALKRNKFDSSTIKTLTEAYRLLFRSRVGLENARDILRNRVEMQPEVEHLLQSIEYQQNGRHGRGGEQRRKAA